jgi:hypothetical protein
MTTFNETSLCDDNYYQSYMNDMQNAAFRLTVHYNRHQSVTLCPEFTQHFQTKFMAVCSAKH